MEKTCRRCGPRFGASERHCPVHHGYLLLHSLEGDLLRGRYRVREPIGSSTHAIVFRAHDEELGCDVAVKALLLDPDGYKYAKDRLNREAQTYVALSDPRFPRVFARGELEDGRPYFVYEYIPGATLADVIAAERWPLHADRAVRIAAQIAAAMAEAHEQGLIHQDLNPGAIRIYRDHASLDIVKIIDFGMVGLGRADAGPQQSSATRPLGTPGYMSPEQWEGRPLDERADIYSLGAVLYEALCRRPPFEEADRAALQAAVLGSDPPPPSTRNSDAFVPARLEEVVLRMLARDRDVRPGSMVEVCDLLEDAAGSPDLLRHIDYERVLGPYDLPPVPPIPADAGHDDALLVAGPTDALLAPPEPPPEALDLGEILEERELEGDTPVVARQTGSHLVLPLLMASDSEVRAKAEIVEDGDVGFEDEADTEAGGFHLAPTSPGLTGSAKIWARAAIFVDPVNAPRAFGPRLQEDEVNRFGRPKAIPLGRLLDPAHKPRVTPRHPDLDREEEQLRALLRESTLPRPVPQRAPAVSPAFVAMVVVVAVGLGVGVLWGLVRNDPAAPQQAATDGRLEPVARMDPRGAPASPAPPVRASETSPARAEPLAPAPARVRPPGRAHDVSVAAPRRTLEPALAPAAPVAQAPGTPPRPAQAARPVAATTPPVQVAAARAPASAARAVSDGHAVAAARPARPPQPGAAATPAHLPSRETGAPSAQPAGSNGAEERAVGRQRPRPAGPKLDFSQLKTF